MSRLAALLLGASVTHCSFPEYAFLQGAGAGGTGDAGATGDASGTGAAPPSESGSAGLAEGGLAGTGADAGSPQAGTGDVAGAAGAAGAGCTFPPPLQLPPHCFDRASSNGETGVDCGGAECGPCTRADPCVHDSDCASGTCANEICSQALRVRYTSIISTEATSELKFRLDIDYLATAPSELAALRIRYYFNHNGVSEPVIGRDPQAFLDPGDAQRDITDAVRARVYRTMLGPLDHAGHKTDSYLEIGFESPSSLTTGTRLTVIQNIVAGGQDIKFEQQSHYSFINGSDIENDAVTVYSGERRLWGVEPPMADIPTCAFAAGVNLAGRALTVDGELISAEADDLLSYVGGQNAANPSAQLLPAADMATTALLSTWHTMSGSNTASWHVPNGAYWAYAWLISTASTSSGTLSFQGQPTDQFVPFQRALAAGWALLGPYWVDVSNQQLLLSTSGSVNVAGVKLYQADRAPTKP